MALASINGSNGYIWSIPSDITVAYKSGNINYQIYFTNPDACYYTVDLLIDGQTVYEQPAQRGNSSVAGYWTCEASDYASTALDMMVGYTSRPFSIVLRSYSDSDYSIYLGSVTRTGNVTVSATCRPLFTTFTLANENKSIANTDKYSNVLVTSSTSTLVGTDAGRCISGISKVKGFVADANQMIPKYSATGDYYRFTIDGVSADADFVDGDVSIYIDNATPEESSTMTAYDSRGLSTTVTLPFTHIAEYSSVSAYNLVAHRTDEIETETTLSFSGIYFNEYFGGGTTGILNTVTAHWRYKPTTDAWGAQTWNAITVTDTNGILSFEDTIAGDLGATGFDADKSFSIEIRLFDKLTNVILETTLPKGKPVLHLTKEGVSVMAKYDATLGGSLQVTGDTYHNGIEATELFTKGSLSRQAIMNGNFDVWQRGTSFSVVDTSYFAFADRWKTYADRDGGTLPTLTLSRQQMTSGDVLGAFYYSRLTTNGAGTSLGASSRHWLWQNVENGTSKLCGAGKFLTLSFYARSSIANKKIGVFMQQSYGSGGSPSATEVLTGDNFTLTSDWVRYTCTFETNTLSGKTFGTTLGTDILTVGFQYMWGTGTYSARVNSSGVAETYVGSGNIDIAQVQLCSGDVALPFCPKSFDEEYMACQRYYQTTFPYGVTVPTNSQQDYEMCMPHSSTFGTVNTGYGIGYVKYRVPIRTAVTPVVYPFTTSTNTGRVSNGVGTDQAAGSGTVGNASRWGFRVFNNSGGNITDGGSIFIFHWSVDAEL